MFFFFLLQITLHVVHVAHCRCGHQRHAKAVIALGMSGPSMLDLMSVGEIWTVSTFYTERLCSPVLGFYKFVRCIVVRGGECDLPTLCVFWSTYLQGYASAHVG